MSHTTSSRKRTLITASAASLGALALTFAGTAAAQAHVGVSTNTSEAGAYAVATVSVPHGCDASPTTQISIKIPEGIDAVTPTRNAFYSVEKVTETLDTPITDGHGNEVTERVAEVVYTATTPLPADQRDSFELSLQLPENAAGSTLFFPTVQTCEEGEAAWVQIPAEGQDAHELELPAPAVEITEAGASSHDTEEAETAEAADQSDEGTGGQSALAITGVTLGALGLITGAFALLRSRK